ncbi:TPA: hypothetical protein ACISVX_001879 [Salmonella enterica subsp. diarizonae serovar 50:k:z35]
MMEKDGHASGGQVVWAGELLTTPVLAEKAIGKSHSKDDQGVDNNKAEQYKCN